MDAALEYEQTTKRYGKQTALDGLTLAVSPGEIVGFLGPNGAGKTTAIHLAMGFLRPSGGRGTILGKQFGDPQTRTLVGYLPDSPAFFSGTAHDAVALAGSLSGMRDPQLRARTREMLDTVNLNEPKKNVRNFSRGMQQRVALAAALIHDPAVLILDEPTSALDPTGVIELRELLRAAREAGKAIFFSSHQLSEVEEICDSIVFLRKGKLERTGTLDELTAVTAQFEIIARVTGRLPQFYGKPISDHRSRFVVSKYDQRTCIEMIWAHGGEVLSVTRLRRSLEELFTEEGPAQ